VTEFEFQLHATGTRTLAVELDFPGRRRRLGMMCSSPRCGEDKTVWSLPLNRSPKFFNQEKGDKRASSLVVLGLSRGRFPLASAVAATTAMRR
jgi:hypothetical protein